MSENNQDKTDFAMSNTPVGGTERWLSMAEAAPLTPYSAEYLSLLARKRKLPSKKIQNTWFTTKAALEDYMHKQMLRAQVQNGNFKPEELFPKVTPVPGLRSYGEDVKHILAEQTSAPVPTSPVVAPVPAKGESHALETAHVEKALERVLDKKMLTLSREAHPKPASSQVLSKGVSYVRTVFSSKSLALIALIGFALMVIFPVPVVLGIAGKTVNYAVEAFKDSNTVMGFRPGTHANEILLLDKQGNISIMGHIETEGQLRSYAPDGTAPIVVDSKTTATNLSADYLDGVSGEEFTLAFVTKNGNVTTEDVHFKGNVEVGQTLSVEGATKLLSTLEVDGGVKVFGQAEFEEAMTVLGPAYFKSLVTLADNLNVEKNITVRGSVEAGSSVTGKSGSFGSLSARNGLNASGKIVLGTPKEVLTIDSKNITVDREGNVVIRGVLRSPNAVVEALSAANSTTTNATSTNFFTENLSSLFARITSLIVDDASIDALTATSSVTTNATTTNATSTALFATTASSTNLYSTNFNLGFGLLGNATTTNLFSSVASSTDLFSTNAIFTDLFGTRANLTSLLFTSATGTSATTTSFFATTASSTNLFATASSLSTLLFNTATGTAATTTNFFATTASSTNLFSTNSSLANLIFGFATGTQATTTNFFATRGTFDELYVNDYQQNDGTFVINSTVPTGDIFAVTDNALTSGTLIHQTLTANAGNGQVSRGQIIDLIDSTVAGGGYEALSINVSGSGVGSGSKTLLSLNPGGNNELVFDSTGALRPTTSAASNTNTIGSASYYFKNGYFDTLTANNLSGTVVTGDTSNNTWTVGSDEVGDSLKALIFQRNSGSGNATLSWDAGINDLRYLSVNYPFNATYTVSDASISTAANLYSGSLTNNTTSGTQKLLSLTNTGTGTTENGIYINNTGTGTTGLEIAGTWTNGILTNNNSINTGSGNITTTGTGTFGNIVAATQTLTDLLFTRATGTSATTTNFFSTTASSTNLYASLATITNAILGNSTTTNATSTTSFATTASSTNLYATNFNLGTGSVGSLTSSNQTITDLLFTRATGTSATTTNFFSTTASSTNLFSSLASIGGSALNVVSSGLVGIGTTNPTDKLHVVDTRTTSGNAAIYAQSTGANVATGYAGYFEKTGASVTNVGLYASATGGTNNYAAIFANGNVGIGSTNPGEKLDVNGNIKIGDGFAYEWGAASTLITGNSSTNSLALRTNGTNRVTVDSTGNVGIGTSTPAALLSIHGTGATTPRVVIDNGAGTPDTWLTLHGGNSDTAPFLASVNATDPTTALYGWGMFNDAANGDFQLKRKANSASWSNVLTVQRASGNIGIGTTNPITALQVEGGVLAHTNGNSSGYFLTGNTKWGRIWSESGSADIFSLGYSGTLSGAGTPVLSWNGSGNVGIGTTTPAATLNVYTNSDVDNTILRGSSNSNYVLTVQNGGGTGKGLYLGVGNTGSDASIISANNSAGTNFFTVTDGNSYFQNGNLGIGTTTPQNKVEIFDVSNPQLRLSADPTNYVTMRSNSLGRLTTTGGANSTATFTSSSGTHEVFVTGSNTSTTVNVDNNSGAAIALQNTSNTNGNYSWLGAYNSNSNNISGVAFVADGAGAVNPAGHMEFYTRASGAGITEALRITGAGNVGIGTTTPATKLHLYGGASGQTAYSGLGSGLVIENSARASLQFLSPTGNDSDIYFGNPSDPTDGSIGYDNTAHSLTFRTNTGTRMTINSSGNVGIATSSPFAKLDVYNASAGVNALNVTHNNASEPLSAVALIQNLQASNSPLLKLISTAGGTANLGGNLYIENSSNNLSVRVDDVSGDTSPFVIDQTGNVGIGTTNPSFPLDIQAATAVARVKSTTTANEAYFDATDGTTRVLHGVNNDTGSVITGGIANAGFLTTMGAQALQLGANATAGLTLLSGGNVGIGTTNPAQKFTVLGASGSPASSGTTQTGIVRITSNTNASLDFGNLSTSPWTSWIQSTDSTDLASKYPIALNPNGGNVGIGTTTPTNQLTIDSSAVSAEAGIRLVSRVGSVSNGIWDLEARNNPYFAIENTTLGTKPFVISGNNVGIGTTNPGYKLEVSGTFAATNILATASTTLQNFTFVNATGTSATTTSFFSTTASSTNLFSSVAAIGGNAFNVIASGNVGIGTTNPGQKLHVYGVGSDGTTRAVIQDTGANSQAIVRLTNDAHSYDIKVDGANQTDDSFKIYDATAGADRLVIKSDGNVGIGTSTPNFDAAHTDRAFSLDTGTGSDKIAGFDIAGNRTTTNSIAGKIQFFNSQSAGGTFGPTLAQISALTASTVSTGQLRFSTVASAGALATAMTIDSSQNVGIGTTTPFSRLHIAGTGASLTIEDTSGSTNAKMFNAYVQSGKLVFRSLNDSLSDNSSSILTMTVGGNVGIGTTNPSQKFNIDTGVSSLNQGAPGSSGTTQNGIARLRPGAATYGETLDIGMNVVSGASYAWIQSTNATNLATNYNLALNPNGGNVGVGTTNPGGKLEVNIPASASGVDLIRFMANGGNYGSILMSSTNDTIKFQANANASNLTIDATAAATGNIYITPKSSANVLISQGNLGLGTTTPYARLAVSGFSSGVGIAADALSGFTGNLLDLKVASTTKFSINQAGDVLHAGSTTLQAFTFTIATGTSATTTNSFATTASSTNLFSSLAAIGGVQGLNVIAGGNVGIGTTNPLAKLQVSGGNIQLDNNQKLTGLNTIGNIANLAFIDTNNITQLAGTSNSNGAYIRGGELAIVSGNVGIGTTSPTDILSISSASPTLSLTRSANTNGALLKYWTAGTADWLAGTQGTSDSDYHIYSYGTASAVFNILRSNGNVGIGTTNPAQKLTVKGNIEVRSAADAAIGRIQEQGTDEGQFQLLNGGVIQASIRANGDSYLARTTGNVGIGSITPGQKLDITGSARVSGKYFVNDGTRDQWEIGTDSTAAGLYLYNVNDGAYRLSILDSNGNVGIGTTNPAAKLTVVGAASGAATATILLKGAATDSDGLQISNNNSTNTVSFLNPFSGPMTFGTNNAEKVRIDSAGNVGIGSTTPFARLAVSGFTTGTSGIVADALSGFTGNLLDLKLASTTKFSVNQAGDVLHAGSTTLQAFTFTTATGTSATTTNSFATTASSTNLFSSLAAIGGAQGLNVVSSGNVGIGTTNPGQKLQVVGTAWVNRPAAKVDSNGGAADFGGEVDFTNTDIGNGVNGYLRLTYPDSSTIRFGTDIDGHLTGTAYRDIQFGRTGSPYVTFKDGGNVGIGTTIPGDRLSVVNSGSFAALQVGNGTNSSYFGYAHAATNYNTGAAAGDAIIRGSNGIDFGPNNGFSAMHITSAGNVGIGTTSPSTLLNTFGGDVKFERNTAGDVQTVLTVAENTASLNTVAQSHTYSGTFAGLARADMTNIEAQVASSLVIGTVNSGTAPIVFAPGRSEVMRIKSDGNVGIGSTNPGTKLTVNGILGVGADELPIQETSFGFGGAYRVLRLGTEVASRNVALNVDPSAVTGGNFSGFGQILIGNRGILAPNAAGTDWFGVLRATSTKVYLGGSMSSGDLVGDGLVVSGTNVGIGTTNPTSLLHVYTTSGSAQSTTVENSGDVRIQSVVRNSQNALYAGVESSSGGGIATGALAGAGVISSNSAKALQLATNASVALTILSGGNVGIGTTTPFGKFHVESSTNSDPKLAFFNNPNSGSAAESTIYASNGYTTAESAFVEATGASYTTSGGFVQDAAVIGSGTGLAGGLSLMARANAPIRFYTNGHTNERMRIDENGNVGIGTTTTTSLLSLYSSAPAITVATSDGADNRSLDLASAGAYGDSRGGGIQLVGNETATTGGRVDITAGNVSTGHIQFNTGGSNVMRITNGGNIGVGTTTPTSRFVITDNFGSTNAIAALTLVKTDGNSNDGATVALGGFTGGKYNGITGLGDGRLLFYTNNSSTNFSAATPAMVIRADGNVGIGTISPAARLEVTDASATELARFTGNNGTVGTYVHFRDNANSTGRGYVGYGSTLFTSLGISDFGIRSQGGAAIAAGGGTTRAYFDASGNAGLGGTITATSTLAGSVMVIQNTGNVGIGTTNPLSQFDIAAATASMSLSSSGSINLYLEGTSASNKIDSRRSNDLFFQSNSVTKMVMQASSGNLGLGTTTPYARLAVSGFSSGVGIAADALSGFTGNLLDLKLASTTKFSINQAGDVLHAGSTTLQAFTFTTATGTSATTTNSFATTASSTNLFSTLASIGGVQGLNVIASGSVGIGTTNPGAPLQVNGSGGTASIINGTNTSTYTAGKVTSSASNNFYYGVESAGGGAFFTGGLGNAGAIGTTLATALEFATNNTVQMAILSGGNVGIGTTNPARKLEVAGNEMRLTGSPTNLVLELNNTSGQRWQVSSGSDSAFGILDNGNNYAMYINSSRNVGIGTTTPTAKLQVTGTSGTSDIFTIASSTNTNLLTFNAAGNLGIGTTSPVAKLSVVDGSAAIISSDPSGYTRFTQTNGSAQIGLFRAGSAAGGFYIGGDSSLFSVWDSSFNRLVAVNTSGNLGIGTSTPSSKLAVSGGASIGANYNFAAPTNGLIVEGNVGIGTTSTGEKLDVTGKIRTSDSLVINSGSGVQSIAGAAGMQFAYNGENLFTLSRTGSGVVNSVNILAASTGIGPTLSAAGETNVPLNINSKGTGAIVFNSGIAGNVGIGTTTPTAKLQITGTSGTSDIFTIASSTNTNLLTVNAAGNVGIGTTNPGKKLVVYNGSLEVNQSGTGHIKLSGASTDGLLDITGSTLRLADWTTGTKGLAVNLTNGNVGIGTTNPAATLQVTGTGLVTGAFTAGDTTTKSYSSFGTNATSHSLSSAGDLLVSGKLEVDGTIFSDSGSISFATASTTGDLEVGGQLLASDGSAGNPSYTFKNDTDTGLFRNGTNVLNFATAGAERMRIDANGNVGIGTTTPSSKLAVSGGASIGANYNFAAPTNGLIVEGNVGIGTTNPVEKLNLNSATVSSGVQKLLVGTLNGTANIGLGYLANGSTHTASVIDSANSLPLYFTAGASATPNMVILSGGNVGIGTTNPGAVLEVDSAGANNSIFNVSSNVQAAIQFKVAGTTKGNLLWNYNDAGTSNGTAMHLQNTQGKLHLTDSSGTGISISGGNVGIGTTTPTAKLQITGTSGTADIFTIASSTNTNLLTFNAAGNLGIGTSNPIYKLDIQTADSVYNTRFYQPSSSTAAYNTSVLTGAMTSAVGYFGIGGSTTANASFRDAFVVGTQSAHSLNLNTNDSPRLSILSGGNVGIGTTNPGNLFEVSLAQNAETVAKLVNSSAGTAAATTLKISNGTTQAGLAQFGTGYTSSGMARQNGGYLFATGAGGLTLNTEAAQPIYFGINSSEKMRIDTAGNVGIGTTTPSAKFAVRGSGTTSGFLSYLEDSAGAARFTQTDSGNIGVGTSTIGISSGMSRYLTIDTPNMGGTAFGLEINGNRTTADAVVNRFDILNQTNLKTRIESRTGLSAVAGGQMLFYTANTSDAITERMRIDQAGNVGIGTTTPMATLNVHTASGSNPTFTISDGDIAQPNINWPATAAASFGVNSSTAGGINLAGLTDADGTTPLTFGSYFGTTDPTDSLPAIVMLARKSDGGTSSQALGNAETVFQLKNHVSDLITVLGSGNVGIGTTNPGAALQVQSGNLNMVSGHVFLATAKNLYFDAGGDSYIGSNGTNDEISLTTGGTEAIHLKSGNVGIGLTNPTQKLDVTGNVAVSGTGYFGVNATTSGSLTSGTLRVSTDGYVVNAQAITSTGILSNRMANGSGTLYWGVERSTGGGVLTGTTAYASVIGTDSANPFQIGVNNIVAMTVLSSGNIGIGTTNPGQVLDVKATGAAQARFFGYGNSTTRNDNGQIQLGNDTNQQGRLDYDAASQTYLRLINTYTGTNSRIALTFGSTDALTALSSGNVGIGTTTPTAKLQITGTSGSADIFTIASSTNSNLLTFSAAGNLGIGTSNPQSALSVVGTADIRGNTNSQLRISDTSGTYVNWQLSNSNQANNTFSITPSTAAGGTTFSSPSFVINSSGNVGIGTTNPGYKVDVVGSAHFSGLVDADHFVATSTTATSTFAGFIDVNGTGSNATSTFASNLWVKGTLRTGTGSLYFNDTSISAANGGFQFNTTGNSFLNAVSGNLGIGTTTPTSKFFVTGTAGTSDIFTIASSTNTKLLTLNAAGNLGIGTTTPPALLTLNDPAAVDPFYIGSSTPKLIVKSTGNIGIGTSSPIRLLSLQKNQNADTQLLITNTDTTNGTSRATVALTSGTANGVLTAIGASSPGVYVGASSSHSLYLITGGTNKVEINTSGTVGIGTAASTYNLDVYGSQGMRTLGTSGQYVIADVSSTNANLIINAQGGGSDPGYTIRVNGSNVFSFDAAASGVYSAAASRDFIWQDFTGVGTTMRLSTTGVLTTLGAMNANGAPDIAENVPVTDQSIEAGDLVMVDTGYISPVNAGVYDKAAVKKADGTQALLGIISSDPGMLLNSKTAMDTGRRSAENERPLALAGRVPLKVSEENGAVHKGDRLTVSTTTPGYAVKMTDAGQSIAVALENSAGTGKILAFIDKTYWVPETQSDENYFASAVFTQIWRGVTAKLADASNGITEFFANRVHTKELCVGDGSGETCITRSQLDSLLTMSGMSVNAMSSSGSSSGNSSGTSTPSESGEGNATTTESVIGSESGGTASSTEDTTFSEVEVISSTTDAGESASSTDSSTL